MSDPIPTRRSLRKAMEPVFVDPSGRRRRGLRVMAAALSAAAVVYVGLLVSAWVGGPVIDAPFLPQHPDAAAPAAPASTPDPAAHPTAATPSPSAAAPHATPATSAPALAPVSAVTPLPTTAPSPHPTATPSPTPTAPGKSATAPGHNGTPGGSTRPSPPSRP